MLWAAFIALGLVAIALALHVADENEKEAKGDE